MKTIKYLLILTIVVVSNTLIASQKEIYCQPDMSCQDLVEQAKTYGPIILIISIEVPSLNSLEISPNMREKEKQNLEHKRYQAVAKVKNRVFSRIAPYSEHIHIRQKYEGLAAFSVQADAAGIALLLKDPDISQLTKDIPTFISLSDTSPLVGAPVVWEQGFTGDGYAIAVLDTGVDKNHPFLSGKIVDEACFSTNAIGEDPVYGPWATYSLCPDNASDRRQGQPCELEGCEHGTHVAGIAAGYNNSFSSVAKGADIISIQVFVEGEGGICQGAPSPCLLSRTEDQITALTAVNNYFSNYYQIAAVNLSLGGGYYQEHCDTIFSTYDQIVKSLERKNIAVIAASGNNGYIDGISMPACVSSTVSVGSTTKSDDVSSFSNSAKFLNILAPGSDIYSAIPDDKYSYMSGTSMAAPHVAGAYAVLREQEPGITAQQIFALLSGNGLPIKDNRNNIIKHRMQFANHSPVSSLSTAYIANKEMDQDGNIYVAGVDEYLKSSYIMKYDANSNVLWRINFDVGLETMHIDSDSNVFVSADGLYKFDKNGAFLWMQPIVVNGIATDRYGAVYILQDDRVKKYDADGLFRWEASDTEQYYLSKDFYSRNLIRVDDIGNVYAVSTIDCIGNCQQYDKETRVFKISPSGELQWGKTFRVENPYGPYDWLQNIPLSVEIDDSGNLYISGHVCMPAEHNGYNASCQRYPPSMVETNTDDYNLMLLKYTPSGNLDWQVISNADAWGAIPLKMVIDSNSIYLGGLACSEIYEFGCITNEYLTLKYDSSGNLLWENMFSESNSVFPLYQRITDIGYDGSTNTLYATGFTNTGSCLLDSFANRTIGYNATSGDPIYSQLYPIVGYSHTAHLSSSNSPAMIATNGINVSTTFIYNEFSGDDSKDFVTLSVK